MDIKRLQQLAGITIKEDFNPYEEDHMDNIIRKDLYRRMEEAGIEDGEEFFMYEGIDNIKKGPYRAKGQIASHIIGIWNDAMDKMTDYTYREDEGREVKVWVERSEEGYMVGLALLSKEYEDITQWDTFQKEFILVPVNK
jgi:hypothetical protein